VRSLALLLALVLAPQAALARVAAFPESALRVDHKISGSRAGASARQVAEGRLEKAYFYGESASAIVDDPINHRDPTGMLTPDGKFESLEECYSQGGQGDERCQEMFPAGAGPGLWARAGAWWDSLWEEQVTTPLRNASVNAMDEQMDRLASRSAVPPELKDVLPERVLPRETFRQGAATSAEGLSEGGKFLVENAAPGAGLNGVGAVLVRINVATKAARAIRVARQTLPSREALLGTLPEAVYVGRKAGAKYSRVAATVAEFNPRIYEMRAGDIGKRLASVKHGIFPGQAESIGGLTNKDLLRFRLEDPISSHGIDSGIQLTGGHHRINEIMRRVADGTLDPDALVPILVHD